MATVSASDLRKFGLTVGAAFLLFGGISWWRGHDVAPRVLWTLGALLIVPGVVAPRLLGPIQRWWMAGAAFLGHVNTRVLLTVAYYVVLTPLGFVMRLVRDPLNRSMKERGGTNWVHRTQRPVDPASYERQF
jgi:saxitoxin biosynthesis operon SxtJ-like protein